MIINFHKLFLVKPTNFDQVEAKTSLKKKGRIVEFFKEIIQNKNIINETFTQEGGCWFP